MNEYLVLLYAVLCLALGGFSLIRESRHYSVALFFAVATLMAAFLLARDFQAASDATAYVDYYRNAETLSSALSAHHQDYFFALILWLGNQAGLTSSQYLTALGLVQVTFTSWGVWLLSPKRYAPAILPLLGLSSTFFLLYSNVLRQGLALAVAYPALGLLFRGRPVPALPFILASIGAHKSAVFLHGAALLGLWASSRGPRVSYSIVIVIPIAFWLGVSLLQIIDLGYVSERVAFYLDRGRSYPTLYPELAVLTIFAIVVSHFSYRASVALSQRLISFLIIMVALTWAF